MQIFTKSGKSDPFVDPLCGDFQGSCLSIGKFDIQSQIQDPLSFLRYPCPLCRKKYGNTNGKYQEQEGAPLVREFLADTGMTAEQIDRVAYLVGHHHSPAQIDGIDYQILIEADYIVNASESGYSQQAIRTFLEHTMKTAAGIRLTKTVFGI